MKDWKWIGTMLVTRDESTIIATRVQGANAEAKAALAAVPAMARVLLDVATLPIPPGLSDADHARYVALRDRATAIVRSSLNLPV